MHYDYEEEDLREFESLPGWACVALLARCLKRLLPILTEKPPVRDELREQIEAAVFEIEDLAAGNTTDVDSLGVIDQGSAAADDADQELLHYVNTHDDLDDFEARSIHNRANAAGHLYNAIMHARNTASHLIEGFAKKDVALEALEARSFAWGAVKERDFDLAVMEVIDRAMRSDLSLVQRAANTRGWDDTTRVAPNFFGPLWPDGPPSEWPEAVASEVAREFSAIAREGAHPPIQVFLDPGDAPTELITEFYVALGALYRSLGGSGLEFVDDERRCFVGEETIR